MEWSPPALTVVQTPQQARRRREDPGIVSVATVAWHDWRDEYPPRKRLGSGIPRALDRSRPCPLSSRPLNTAPRPRWHRSEIVRRRLTLERMEERRFGKRRLPSTCTARSRAMSDGTSHPMAIDGHPSSWTRATRSKSASAFAVAIVRRGHLSPCFGHARLNQGSNNVVGRTDSPHPDLMARLLRS